LGKSDFAGMMFQRFFMKYSSFRFDLTKNMVDKGILVSDWTKYFYSEATVPIRTKLCRNNTWKVLYKTSSFYYDQTKSIDTTGNSCF